MTDLDDGLNTSTPVWAPPNLTAWWEEAPPNLTTAGNPDAVCFLDEQTTGDFKVSHSLDDGFPGPVTMSTGSDASGIAEIPLNGKEGITADQIGWRGSYNESGAAASAGTVIDITYTSGSVGLVDGDFVLCCVVVGSQQAQLTQLVQDPASPYYWNLLGTITDGTESALYLYGRQYWTGLGDFKFVANRPSLNYRAVVSGVYARTPDTSVWVPFDPQETKVTPELSGSAITNHTSPTCHLGRRGFAVSVWALPITNSASPITYTGSGSTVAASGSSLVMASSGLSQPGDYTFTATTFAATNVMMMATIALEVADRPRMDAREYFSPFNKDSPVYGWARDTAYLRLDQNTITPAGPVSTEIYAGVMADVEVKGRQAELTGVSRTRLDLDKSLVLPVVSGDRENCSIDWLSTWLMARGGQYAGPAPTKWTRYWNPMYGSVHAHYESPYCYSGALLLSSALSPVGPYSKRPPTSVPGPFMSAMYAKQTATEQEEIFLNMARLDLGKEKGLPLPGQDDSSVEWPFYDQFSQANNAGRAVFWVRGDAVASAPSWLDPARDFVMRYNLYCITAASNYLGYIIIKVQSSNRFVSVEMGGDSTGSTTVVFNGAGMALPTDGGWHFIGVKWNFGLGQVTVKVDGLTQTSSSYATNGDNNVAALPVTEDAHVAAGNSYTNYFTSHVPTSDVLIEAGPESWTRDFSDHYPTPVGLNATARPAYQKLMAVAESTPWQGWNLLTELAQSSITAYRVDEGDNYNWLPLSYFGEPAQMTVTTVEDTEVNAGELDVKTDPSKTRNIVTVKFSETRVNSKPGPVMTLTSAIEIPKGTSEIVFSLDEVTVEIHGASIPFSYPWTLTVLTAAQIAAPATIPTNVHYLTATTTQDGSGTVLTGLSITAKIVETTASTVVVRFFNTTGKSIWLSNNGEEVPFLQILGYSITVTDGYLTRRDAGSIGFRRERSLDVEMPWVQDRDTANYIAGHLVTALARPRAEVTVEVMGDPRRKPGQMVELLDAQGTQAEGTWRILEVIHNGSGPRYTQTLQLVHVLPVAVWDGAEGWDETVWSD